MIKGGGMAGYLDFGFLLIVEGPREPSGSLGPRTATNCSLPSFLVVAFPNSAPIAIGISGSGMLGESAEVHRNFRRQEAAVCRRGRA
jgi:hypothetical protein